MHLRSLAVLLLVLMCSGCGDESLTPSLPASPRATITPTESDGATVSPTASKVPAPSSDPSAGSLRPAPFGENVRSVSFGSPTGNLTCALDGDFVECAAQERTWQAPPEPRECYEGTEMIPDAGEWGRLSLLGAPDGQAEFSCGLSPLYADGNVLQYGQYVYVDRIRCESRREGLTCSNVDSGHGFSLSRDKVSLF